MAFSIDFQENVSRGTYFKKTNISNIESTLVATITSTINFTAIRTHTHKQTNTLTLVVWFALVYWVKHSVAIS